MELYLEVADVEAYHDELKKRKIQPTSPLTDQWWGDRTFTIQDPYGYQIWFYQNFAEPKLPKAGGAKVVSETAYDVGAAKRSLWLILKMKWRTILAWPIASVRSWVGHPRSQRRRCSVAWHIW